MLEVDKAKGYGVEAPFGVYTSVYGHMRWVWSTISENPYLGAEDGARRNNMDCLLTLWTAIQVLFKPSLGRFCGNLRAVYFRLITFSFPLLRNSVSFSAEP